jgi:hypothetical protein
VFGLGVVLLAAGAPSLAYGLLDLLAPQIAIRWQVASTSKHKDGVRGQVGEPFQRWVGVDPAADPWADPRARRHVRWIGFFLVLVSGLLVGAGIALVVAS